MRRFRRTTLLTVGCLAVLVGIGLAKRVSFEPAFWLALFIPSLLVLKKKSWAALLIVIMLGLSLGLWRGDGFSQKLDQIKALNGQQVTVQATASSDAIYSTASQLEFTVKDVRLAPDGQPLAGSFKISGFGEPMVYRGDRIQISGKLYPMRGANQARIAYAQLETIGADSSWMNSFTRNFKAGMYTALPEPSASFGLGILIGQRNSLPSELTNQLIMVGLVHIVAVSGYNLTIIIRAVSRLKLGSKFQRLAASLLLIAGFLLMTGFSASIVRASLVAVLGLWAWFYGRSFKPVLLIALAAAITGLANPFYVWGDLGWYLSFLAFFGVLVIAPLVAQRFKRRPKNLTMVVIETLSAEVMTLPLIMMSFGQLSLVGLVANALVVPLIPFAMLLAAVAATAGMWLTPIVGWLAWPANLLLTYILDIAQLLASVPGIFLHRSISTPTMLYFYALVLLLTAAAYRQHNHPKIDTIQR
ncbi:TPA: hypothetical protein DIS56_03730 [Candidatus Saccharibacteria bacterium]|nr:MAG: internalization-related competence protein ComEC/Rec2 protein [Candidatus Saccharibacteria bacterium GW2011_GWA2_46_10]OGL35800.1 MAG: hypothetical protein A3F05_02080 [Candidatus Saccharibacteria bacterium RIFCSPHIGHO2_12_FULL_47_17]HCM52209.1 hypothetical protein [Candidatus Saccharibacteria bacterium]